MSAGEAPDSRPTLESIRAQLRELGYLEGPLSGWMAPGRHGPSSLLRVSLAASLRVGIVGGPLLGVPAALAVAVANRPHFSNPRDLLILAAYLSAALGLTLLVLELLTEATLSLLARRGLILVGAIERLAGRVGLLFGAAATLYLASLFRGGRVTTAGDGGWIAGLPAWLGWGAALVAALAIGHVIGRLTRLGSLISVVAAGVRLRDAGPAVPSARTPRARAALAAGALLLATAAGYLIFAPGPAPRTAWDDPAFAPVPTHGRLILVGVDGLDAGLLDRLREHGRIPALDRLVREGARYDIEVTRPRVPPVAWTTIATGEPASEHGILGYQAEKVPGLAAPVQEPPEPGRLALSLRLLLPPMKAARSPVSSGLRRSRAVWEILADGGVETAAVNWWATWPAVEGEGMVVSERALARLAAGLPPDRDAAPPPLQEELARRFPDDLDRARADTIRAGIDPADEIATRAGVIDGYHALVGGRLYGAGLARALFLYLPGLDITRAKLADDGAQPPPAVVALASQIDALLGPIIDDAGPEDLIVIVGDPGRSPGASARGEGVLLVAGARVVPGRRTRPVDPLDIAPTVLALMGFPAARDMPGRPIVDFLRAGDPAARLGPTVPSYGPRPPAGTGAGSDPFDEEVLDRLRSLGYIQ